MTVPIPATQNVYVHKQNMSCYWDTNDQFEKVSYHVWHKDIPF